MTGVAELDPRSLRSAIEFSVLIAEELTKRRQGGRVPPELRRWFGTARIPNTALGRLRRTIEADDGFRELVAAGAVDDVVDPIGRLWLQRPSGWETAIVELAAAASAVKEDAGLRDELRREAKRRLAAEQALARVRVDLVTQRDTIKALETEIEDLRTDLVKADESIAELRVELADLRLEARHARDRERAAAMRLEAERAARADAVPPPASGDAVADEPAAPAGAALDPAELDELARHAREVAERLAALAEPVVASAEPAPAARRERRRPLALPGGIIATSREAAEFLVRSDAAVLVDGYNVAKLGWPTRNLEAQRTLLLDALENVARRFGTDITVVFDGTTVVGAHSARRRLLRVVWSPEGVIADDVIRDEVRRLPASRAVVVVTNDAEIVDDVRALGANVVPSNALLGVI